MKLRMTDTHIRFRIDNQEVDCLLTDRQLKQTLFFPTGDVLHYQIEISELTNEMSLNFTEQTLKLNVPFKQFSILIDDRNNKDGIISSYQINDKEIKFSLEIDLMKTKDACISR